MVHYADLTCRDEERRSLNSLEALNLNGIDYIEISAQDLNSQRFIHVYFIRDLSDEDLAGFVNKPDLFTISGGVRIRDIKVLSVKGSEGHLVIEVDRAGDFSIYQLEIKSDHLDPAYAQCDFSFKGGCPSHLDPKTTSIYSAKQLPEPIIDYNAKDYASFRKALIDLIPTLIPDWEERHEADLGIMLLELLAYAGDQLSYFQDSVANEAYLETALQRISVRRHARLIDYRMHDGASARAFVCICVDNESVTLPKGTQVLTRINVPLGTEALPPDPIIPYRLKKEALKKSDAVFETYERTELWACLNNICIHTWGGKNCCLPRDTTSVDLEDLKGDLSRVLKEGDFLLLEEVKGPITGKPEDRNSSHRQIVRLTKIEKKSDPLFNNKGEPRKNKTDPEMPILRVNWNRADKLDFPLCISSSNEEQGIIEGVSVAKGNLVLADHGRTYEEPEKPEGKRIPLPIKPIHESQRRAHRIHLKYGPLSYRIYLDPNKPKPPVRDMFKVDPHLAKPQVLKLEINNDRSWTEAPDSNLLNSNPFDPHYVVETDNSGRAIIRFGDNKHGKVPPERDPSDEKKVTNDQKKGIAVTYRVGVGRSGNVGPDSLVHIIDSEKGIGISLMKQKEKRLPIYNPLPARGGIDPEPIENVKQLAPAEFHAKQFRAVTEADYADAAKEHPDVDKAVAAFRWTGSWHTVFISIDPFGTNEVNSDLKKQVKNLVEQRALAGYDVVVEGPTYVPLEIDVDICTSPDHFMGDVERALLDALSRRKLSDGSLGFFYPDRFTFNQPLYLSELYDAIHKVKGVDSARVTKFNRLGKPINDDKKNGFIRVGNLEIIRLDNDPSLPDNGILKLNIRGGK